MRRLERASYRGFRRRLENNAKDGVQVANAFQEVKQQCLLRHPRSISSSSALFLLRPADKEGKHVLPFEIRYTCHHNFNFKSMHDSLKHCQSDIEQQKFIQMCDGENRSEY